MKVKDFLNKCMPQDTMNISINHYGKPIQTLTPRQIRDYGEYLKKEILLATILSFQLNNDTIKINIDIRSNTNENT